MSSYFKKRLEKLEAKKTELTQRGLSSQDIEEVRAINAQLNDINEELTELRAEIAAAEKNEARSTTEPVNGNIVASFAAPTVGTQKRTNENPFESMEYRRAFKDFVQRDIPMPKELIASANAFTQSLPAEQRAGAPITTTTTEPAIPLTIMREVINTVRKRYGNLYAKVRKTSVQGGVDYPIGALQASFKWITESTVSPNQGVDALGTVSFKYHTAEIRIARSFLAQILTIEAFEEEITRIIAIAYAQAMDYGIVNGTGSGQMTGILNDPAVIATNNVVTMTAAQIGSWSAWRKDFFKKIPLGYRAGEFIFPLSTVESYLETMADANNNPIFRQATGLEVNDGDAMNPSGRFFGRDISLVEPDILPDFDTASSGDVIGIFWQPDEYAINENFGFTMRRYIDERTNEVVDKALVVVDGKVLNPNGIWLIKKA